MTLFDANSPAPGVTEVGGRLLRWVGVDGAARGVRTVWRRRGTRVPRRDDGVVVIDLDQCNHIFHAKYIILVTSITAIKY